VDLGTAPDDGAELECPEEEVTNEDVPSVVHVWTE
jgi:hypothetical protein